jgi:hypothetical protein
MFSRCINPLNRPALNNIYTRYATYLLCYCHYRLAPSPLARRFLVMLHFANQAPQPKRLYTTVNRASTVCRPKKRVSRDSLRRTREDEYTGLCVNSFKPTAVSTLSHFKYHHRTKLKIPSIDDDYFFPPPSANPTIPIIQRSLVQPRCRRHLHLR